jgi:porin
MEETMSLKIVVYGTIILLHTFTYGNANTFSYLNNKGINMEIAYTTDIVSNLSGGIETKTTTLNNFDLILNFNLEEIFNIEGLSGKLYFLSNHGSNPTDFIGDFQGTSNIEAPKATKPYEAWIQKRFNNGKSSVLFGFFDLNSEFDTTDTGSFFINSSHGIGPEFSTSGENGPSIFPYTSLCLRFNTVSENHYFSTAVFDGVPGNPHNPKGIHIHLGDGDGLLSVTETGYLNEKNGSKLGIGFWVYTKKFETFANSDEKENSKGLYLLGETSLFNNFFNGKLTGFFRFGFANESVNTLKQYFGCGIVLKQPFTNKREEHIGLAFANAVLGNSFRTNILNNGEKYKKEELNIELSYSIQLNNWLKIQPDIQYVINPGMDTNLHNAIVFILRTEISF